MEHSQPTRAGESRAKPAIRTAVIAFVAVLLPCAVIVAIIVANRSRGPAEAGVVTPPPPSPTAPAATTAATTSVPAVASPAPPRPPTPAARMAESAESPAAAVESTEVPPEVVEKTKQVLEATEHLDRTVFAAEVEAQRYEEYFIRVWDEFRAVRDKLAVLERAAFETLTYASPGAASNHDWGVTVTRHDGAPQSLDPSGWRAMAGRLREAGYAATELEFHQSEFVHEAGKPARSTVATVLHLVNAKENSRQVLRAKLKVEWSDKPGADGVYVPRAIEAADLTFAARTGDVAFQPVALPRGTRRGFVTSEASNFLLAYDLDGDGRSEILFPGENLLLRNRGNWQFDVEQILAGRTARRTGACVIGDFNGDGLSDLLRWDGAHMRLARGVPGGRFSPEVNEPAVALAFNPEAIAALTAGDVDGDGDLDAWFGQYKVPYAGGQMPTPYYDANDGFPAALLLNDGGGKFTDATEAAGLAGKRLRRTLAGSLVDLDGDLDLDLLVNSDFAGLDIYYNDGSGRFTDVTDQVIDERHNFGMGHTFADFNLDGALDVYTIGMSSTTARRLTAMGAGLKEFAHYQEKRPQMGYGNRMFLAPPASGAAAAPGQAPARYAQPPFRDEIARTGWSWGTVSPDFDNDGDPDLYVANGHRSSTTCRDYCTTYWRRDVYLASSKEDPVMDNLFTAHGIPREVSWNGFEHDVLYMNEGGRAFVNVAHLMGVAFESDGRNAITDDFDGDGKMDLLMSERRWADGVRVVHLLRNAWPTTHNWVGVRLAESRPGFSPLGATVRVRTAGSDVPQIARLVTGDSLTSQQSTAKHFGLGAREKVESIEVTWPNGEVTRVDNPAINRWHDVRPGHAPAAVQ